jgi:hypothetical protein
MFLFAFHALRMIVELPSELHRAMRDSWEMSAQYVPVRGGLFRKELRNTKPAAGVSDTKYKTALICAIVVPIATLVISVIMHGLFVPASHRRNELPLAERVNGLYRLPSSCSEVSKPTLSTSI